MSHQNYKKKLDGGAIVAYGESRDLDRPILLKSIPLRREDCRLVLLNRTYLSCTNSWHEFDRKNMRIVSTSHGFQIPFDNNDETHYSKNLMYFKSHGKVYMEYWIHDHITCEFDPKNALCGQKMSSEYELPHSWPRHTMQNISFRARNSKWKRTSPHGGFCCLPLSYCNQPAFLGVGHQRDGFYYENFFYIFEDDPSKNFPMMAVTDHFVFLIINDQLNSKLFRDIFFDNGTQIRIQPLQFVSALTWDRGNKNVLLLGLGLMDCQSVIVRIKMSEILSMMKPVEK